MKEKVDEIDRVLDRAASVVDNLPEWMRRIEKRSKQEYLARHQFTNPLQQEIRAQDVLTEKRHLSAQ